MPGGTGPAGTSRVPSSCSVGLCVNMCPRLCTDEFLCVYPKVCMCKCECERVCVAVQMCLCVCDFPFCVCNCESTEEECLSSVTLHVRLTRALPVRERNKQKGQCRRHIFTIIGYKMESAADRIILYEKQVNASSKPN